MNAKGPVETSWKGFYWNWSRRWFHSRIQLKSANVSTY